MPTDEILDIEEAARFLKINPSTLYRLVRRTDGPPAFRVGRLLRFRSAALDAWADNGGAR